METVNANSIQEPEERIKGRQSGKAIRESREGIRKFREDIPESPPRSVAVLRTVAFPYCRPLFPSPAFPGVLLPLARHRRGGRAGRHAGELRSEEHTSELQSRVDI